MAIIIIALSTQTTKAQDHFDSSGYWNILAPAPGSSIDDGDIFIAVQLMKGEKFNKGAVAMWIDEYLVTFQTRVTDDKITLIYSHHLLNGKHHIRVNAQTADGGILTPLNWDFFVGMEETTIIQDGKKRRALIEKDEPAFSISGAINVDSRNNFLDGNGKELPQEAKFNAAQYGYQEVSLDVTPRYKRFSFPISGFFTSTENKYLQPRNRYRVGINSDYFEAYYGDHFTMYDNLLVNGNKIHGTELIIKTPKGKFSAVYGDLTKPIDGKLLRLTSDYIGLPYNLRPDSFYVEAGTYKRKIAAGRLDYGTIEEGSTFGVTVMKSWDDTTSIRFGSNPKQNIGFTVDQTMYSKNRVFSINSGYTFTLTTNDYSRHAFRKTEVDSVLKTNLPFDPQTLKPLIVLNLSTSPLNIQNQSSVAWYVKPQIKIKNNTLDLEARRVGSEFVSFANPYVMQDIQEYSASDNLALWEHRINVQARYAYNFNNLYHKSIYTTHNQFGMANLYFAPSEKLPALTAGATYNQREMNVDTTHDNFDKDNILSYNVGLAYSFTIAGMRTDLNGSYINSNRVSRAYPENGSISNIITTSIGQDYPFGLSYNLGYSNYTTTSAVQAINQNINAYNGVLSFNIKKIKGVISANYSLSKSVATQFTPSGARHIGGFGYRQAIFKGFNLNMDGGLSYYDNLEIVGFVLPAKYDSKFLNINLNYSF